MKEIIGQISRIDALAFENEQKNKSILFNEKQRYESQMKKYRDQQLEIADNNAKIVYNQIVMEARSGYQKQEENIKRISGQIEKNYPEVEKNVIEEVFTKLFTG